MKSKRLVRLAAAGVAVALLFGCGGSDSDNAVSGSPPAPVAPGSGSGPQTVTDKGIVSGKIVDEGGAAVPSVKVTLDGTSVTSNEQGFFVFEGAAPGANKALRFEKSGDGINFVLPARTTVFLGFSSGGNQPFKALSVERGDEKLEITPANYRQHFSITDKMVGAVVHVLDLR